MLVVDDAEFLRDAIAEMLICHGYKAARVADGSAALRYLEGAEKLPCLIVIDLVMPSMVGSELVRAIRSDKALAAIRLAMISTSAARLRAVRHFVPFVTLIHKSELTTTLLDVVYEACGLPKLTQRSRMTLN